MKSLLVAIVATVSMTAVAKSGYITEKVCGYNEAGDMSVCRMVTYKDHGPIKASAPECVVMSGEATQFVPCDQVAPSKGHVPAWLAAFNQWFLDRGFTAPAEGDLYTGGAN